MVKIIFYIKSGKQNPMGESPIFAKVNLENKTTTISTGKSIKNERWIASNRLRNLLRDDREKAIKDSLDVFLLKAQRFHNEAYRMGNEITLEDLKSHLKGVQAKQKTICLLDLFDFLPK
ncbi:MAG: hypothetical protein ABIQ27_02000 [Flavobacterium sp.]|uniref:hypothetical protein n=1 Tax=Flavobacterium sp. TaxID=239 RepID=UPI003266D7A2